MADYRTMQPNRATSYSGLSEATTNVTLFEEMPKEVRATLNSYMPLDADDETVKLLRETFKYLPSDGLLRPMMVAGTKKVEIPRLGIEESIEHLASMTDEHDSMMRAQQQLQEDVLRRDGSKCVVSGHYDVLSEELYPDEITADLETAYIVPFALSQFKDEYEKQQIIAVWTNISRYFPSVRSQLNFNYQDINFMIPGTMNQYRVKTFRGFATAHRAELPASGAISMAAHDGRFPLASPILLQVHCAVANILHATGEGAKIARVLRDYDATDGLASNGGTNVSHLLSMTKIALVPHVCRFDGTVPTDD